MSVFLGMDASLSGFGLVAIPGSWGGDFSLVTRMTLEAPKGGPDALRMMALARDVLLFAKSVGATVAVFEDVPSRDAYAIKVLAKLQAYVERELVVGMKLFPGLVNQSTARSFFLGKLPSKDRKRATIAAVDELTDVFVFDDEKDAFVTVNCNVAKVPGVFTYSKPRPAPVRKPRRVAA